MGVSVVVITDKSADSEKIRNYWNPVRLKFKDRPIELLIVDDMNAGIRKAKHNAVFITPWNMVPTYKTLLILEKIGPNQCLLPKIHNSDEYSGAFSINKKEYKGERFQEWSSRKDIRIVKSTMYKV